MRRLINFNQDQTNDITYDIQAKDSTIYI